MNASEAQLSRRALLGGSLAALAGLGGLGFREAPRTPSWRRLQGAGPPARHDHSLTAGGGPLYLFGGRRGGEPLDDLWALDPRSGRWREVTVSGQRPPARFGHNAFYDEVGRRLVIALGQAGSTFFDDVWAFDGISWKRLGSDSARRPARRYGAGGAYDRAGRRLLITHGFTFQGRFDDTWSFDLAQETWTKIDTRGPVPLKRCLLRAFWEPAGKRLYLLGGQSTAKPFLGDFWSLDVARGVWRQERPARLPGARNLYGAVYDERARRWYLVGGATARGPAADTWRYDARAGAWSLVAARGPAPRSGPDVALVSGRLYLFGGTAGDRDLADTWRLTPV